MVRCTPMFAAIMLPGMSHLEVLRASPGAISGPVTESLGPHTKTSPAPISGEAKTHGVEHLSLSWARIWISFHRAVIGPRGGCAFNVQRSITAPSCGILRGDLRCPSDGAHLAITLGTRRTQQ
ncbi:hypothetical protein H4582DRAFT_1310253 [Lactarius indigo]|nr:hypothetical protein H4582DRAFT_1310253 [Lactarius indigo]